jgi:ribonuclease G
MMNEPCSYCEGKGHIKSKITVAYEVFREIRREAPHFPEPVLVINCHTEVARILQATEREELRYLMDRFNKTIQVKAQGNYHQEQFDIYGRHQRIEETGPGAGAPAGAGGGSGGGDRPDRGGERSDRGGERSGGERGGRDRDRGRNRGRGGGGGGGGGGERGVRGGGERGGRGGGERSGGERSGGERSGGERSGGERSGGERSGGERSGGESARTETPAAGGEGTGGSNA